MVSRAVLMAFDSIFPLIFGFREFALDWRLRKECATHLLGFKVCWHVACFDRLVCCSHGLDEMAAFALALSASGFGYFSCVLLCPVWVVVPIRSILALF